MFGSYELTLNANSDRCQDQHPATPARRLLLLSLDLEPRLFLLHPEGQRSPAGLLTMEEGGRNNLGLIVFLPTRSQEECRPTISVARKQRTFTRGAFSAINTDDTAKWCKIIKKGSRNATRLPGSLPAQRVHVFLLHDIKAETRKSSIQHETSEREQEKQWQLQMLLDMTI